MNKINTAILSSAAFLFSIASPPEANAQGQNVSGTVLTTCGSPPVNYVAGQPGILTVDTFGQLCVTGGGGGGGGAVTIADGADVTLGAKADAICGSATGTCTAIALLKFVATAVNSPIPIQSPSVPIGGIGICDGANGTTNPCTTVATVKAASTSAVATDKSLVVQINPQQTPPVSAANFPAAVDTNSGNVSASTPRVVLATNQPSLTNPQPINGAVNVTPTDCSGTITAGGTAQNAIAAIATIHGFTIANIDTSAGSGEPLWMSLTGTAAASTAGSYPLAAPTATTFAGLSSYTAPMGFGINHAVSVIAATTGHKFSCTYW